MMLNRVFPVHYGIFVCLLVVSVSCVPVKKVRYFNDIKELNKSYENAREQKKIAPFDYLYIKVLSTDEKTSKIFNSTDDFRSGNSSMNIISYMVDVKGNINFPFAGDINVGGLSLSEATIKIQKTLSDYMANTAVILKYVDNKITVMGEVQRQGVYPFLDDKINVFEALALSGGMTRYGSHKNVVLVRQENNKVSYYKLNLSDSKIAGSQFYYLLPNDVIIVEPLKSVSSSYQNMTFTTILTALTTLIAILYFANIKP